MIISTLNLPSFFILIFIAILILFHSLVYACFQALLRTVLCLLISLCNIFVCFAIAGLLSISSKTQWHEMYIHNVSHIVSGSQTSLLWNHGYVSVVSKAHTSSHFMAPHVLQPNCPEPLATTNLYFIYIFIYLFFLFSQGPIIYP